MDLNTRAVIISLIILTIVFAVGMSGHFLR
jgi:hypothetical protein